ncbi:MAG: hypothetical protein A3J38_10355 [Gammaproteobacteria bacterium RIFCSPHIGHO2_12_FULL_45_9]|nr:MAG: hypothetical protein A3J38_10355 [Gammaproteobacteria bacterium RIFCSPHIGHO2_12_FULL_45_9]
MLDSHPDWLINAARLAIQASILQYGIRTDITDEARTCIIPLQDPTQPDALPQDYAITLYRSLNNDSPLMRIRLATHSSSGVHRLYPLTPSPHQWCVKLHAIELPSDESHASTIQQLQRKTERLMRVFQKIPLPGYAQTIIVTYQEVTFYCTELIQPLFPGQEYFFWLQEHPLDETAIYKHALTLLKILADFHAAGLLHRDIKTENILYDEVTKTFSFCDFSNTLLLSEDTDDQPEIAGTIAYLAPELQQYYTEEKKPSHTDYFRYKYSSDIYSLGVVFVLDLLSPFIADKRFKLSKSAVNALFDRETVLTDFPSAETHINILRRCLLHSQHIHSLKPLLYLCHSMLSPNPQERPSAQFGIIQLQSRLQEQLAADYEYLQHYLITQTRALTEQQQPHQCLYIFRQPAIDPIREKQHVMQLILRTIAESNFPSIVDALDQMGEWVQLTLATIDHLIEHLPMAKKQFNKLPFQTASSRAAKANPTPLTLDAIVHRLHTAQTTITGTWRCFGRP